MLWELSALGGEPRRLASSTTGADVSHDGKRIAAFQKAGEGVALTILRRDGMPDSAPIPIDVGSGELSTPRWSPDDAAIAFVNRLPALRHELMVIDAAGGKPRSITRSTDINGIAWLPDGSGLVLASSTGSTLVYPPVFNLRWVSRDGNLERQITFGDVSYVQPDLTQAGKLFASRLRLQSEIWGFPVSGSPSDNVKNGRRITQQTAQVQTPTASPDGKAIAYLSDSGGHANVWVARTDGSGSRQLTFESDASVAIGIPVWSPAGDQIVFIRTDDAVQAQWLINPDGSGLRQLVADAASAAWSGDGRWLYYQTRGDKCIDKIPADGGSPVRVRCAAAVPAPSADGTTLFYAPNSFLNANQIDKATPENGQAVAVARYARSRVPLWPTGFALSLDGRWIAVPLKDGATTNIWAIPTGGGPFRQLRDFGRRAILIARQVSWSPDGKIVYAAVAESDADVVLLDGISTSSVGRH
jgi:Tol biopolymer transport system component